MIRKQLADSIVNAEKYWQSARNIAQRVMPVAQEPRLMIRVLECLQKSLGSLISGILKYEYINGNVKLSKKPEENLALFMKVYARKYKLDSGERELLKELIFLGMKHKEAGFEFSKKGKVYLLDDNLKVFELNSEMVGRFLGLVRKMIDKTREKWV